jgi:hypothetical protein
MRIHLFEHTLQVTNENLSHYLDDSCAQFGCDRTAANAEAFEESNLMHSINGRVYGNLDGLNMVVDDKVRWFIAAFGTEVRRPRIVHSYITLHSTTAKCICVCACLDTLHIFEMCRCYTALRPHYWCSIA